MGNPVIHFEVIGKDGAKLQKFYADAFDWKIDTNNPMKYGIVDNGGEGINGGVGAAPEGDGHVTFYVNVPDINAHLEKIEKLGGRTIMPREQIGDLVTLAMFADPEGNVIGLTEGS
ncbi:MAG: glyoxalase [Actinobacteria bacterium]|nr:glyoxalase [Actinomycetota bacterium]